MANAICAGLASALLAKLEENFVSPSWATFAKPASYDGFDMRENGHEWVDHGNMTYAVFLDLVVKDGSDAAESMEVLSAVYPSMRDPNSRHGREMKGDVVEVMMARARWSERAEQLLGLDEFSIGEVHKFRDAIHACCRGIKEIVSIAKSCGLLCRGDMVEAMSGEPLTAAFVDAIKNVVV
jgi:hypothetical protein